MISEKILASKLNLVENGIFPIILDKDGEFIDDDLDTGLHIPGTIQGEGKFSGMPCFFVRTSGCNLRCIWDKGSPCDTPYSSHKPEKNFMTIRDIVSTLNHNRKISRVNHVVISGGEPAMQKKLDDLIYVLQSEGFVVTIETNATYYRPVLSNCELVSMSPKLSTSDPKAWKFEGSEYEYNAKWEERHKRDRRNLEVIWKFIYWTKEKGNDFQLKFVVSSEADIYEIENDFLAKLDGWEPQDIVIMPEGVTLESQLGPKAQEIMGWCVQRGWRFCPRLHVMYWKDARRV